MKPYILNLLKTGLFNVSVNSLDRLFSGTYHILILGNMFLRQQRKGLISKATQSSRATQSHMNP